MSPSQHPVRAFGDEVTTVLKYLYLRLLVALALWCVFIGVAGVLGFL